MSVPVDERERRDDPIGGWQGGVQCGDGAVSGEEGVCIVRLEGG